MLTAEILTVAVERGHIGLPYTSGRFTLTLACHLVSDLSAKPVAFTCNYGESNYRPQQLV